MGCTSLVLIFLFYVMGCSCSATLIHRDFEEDPTVMRISDAPTILLKVASSWLYVIYYIYTK